MNQTPLQPGLTDQQVSDMARRYMMQLSSTATPLEQRNQAMLALTKLAQNPNYAYPVSQALAQYGFTVKQGGEIVNSRTGKPLNTMQSAPPGMPKPTGFPQGGSTNPWAGGSPPPAPAPPQNVTMGGMGVQPGALPSTSGGIKSYETPANPMPAGDRFTNAGGTSLSPDSSGLPGSEGLTFDEAMAAKGLSEAPGDAYFKGATGATLGEVTPSFTDKGSIDPAWTYYRNQSGLRDTYADDYLKDDFASAEMVMRLLGKGGINDTMNPTDQLYGTQQLMDTLTSPGKFINPRAMMDQMFAKVGQIEDPNLQMTYINGALEAMKPYMSQTDYMNLQSEVSRRAEDYFVQGINKPESEKDFLSLLQGIR
jgi:hypothetical protein